MIIIVKNLIVKFQSRLFCLNNLQRFIYDVNTSNTISFQIKLINSNLFTIIIIRHKYHLIDNYY